MNCATVSTTFSQALLSRESTFLYMSFTLIKNKTQTAEINMVNQRILYRLDVSYARQHTFSKVTVTIFENCLHTFNTGVWNRD